MENDNSEFENENNYFEEMRFYDNYDPNTEKFINVEEIDEVDLKISNKSETPPNIKKRKKSESEERDDSDLVVTPTSKKKFQQQEVRFKILKNEDLQIFCIKIEIFQHK